MVRTKADAATRVAAGGKAPKKIANRVQHSPSSGPDKGENLLLGKDNLPVNRYCPRETPAWQKKITFFYNKNDDMHKSTDPQKDDKSIEQNENRNSKRRSSELDDADEMECESFPKKIKSNNVSTDKDTNHVTESNVIDENESMEMDE